MEVGFKAQVDTRLGGNNLDFQWNAYVINIGGGGIKWLIMQGLDIDEQADSGRDNLPDP